MILQVIYTFQDSTPQKVANFQVTKQEAFTIIESQDSFVKFCKDMLSVLYSFNDVKGYFFDENGQRVKEKSWDEVLKKAPDLCKLSACVYTIDEADKNFERSEWYKNANGKVYFGIKEEA